MACRSFKMLVKVDRKSTRLNSSHMSISYAVFCLKKKKNKGSRYSIPEIKIERRHQFERVAYLSDYKEYHPPAANILLEDKKVTYYGAFRRKYDEAPGPQTQVQFL